jgi:hypothetical protein
MSLRSKWAVGKAVRTGLALGGRISHHFRTGGREPDRQERKMVRDVTDPVTAKLARPVWMRWSRPYQAEAMRASPKCVATESTSCAPPRIQPSFAGVSATESDADA